MTTEQANQLQAIYDFTQGQEITKIVITVSHYAQVTSGQQGDSGTLSGIGTITLAFNKGELISSSSSGGSNYGAGSGGWGSAQTQFNVSGLSISNVTVN